MEDLNAKVGHSKIRETCTGSYGTGTRTYRGGMLVEFANLRKFRIMNTFLGTNQTGGEHTTFETEHRRIRVTTYD